MTAWPVPPPARSGPAAAGSPGTERWLCGICASYEAWPPGEYTFRLPAVGLPLYVGHQAQRVVSSGEPAPGDVGACRRFAEVDGLGAVVLIEISADYPSLLWDVAERGAGLSVTAHLDEPPGGGPVWVYFSEVSLTGHPRDPLARVVSSGALALADWEALTGEPAPAGRAVC